MAKKKEKGERETYTKEPVHNLVTPQRITLKKLLFAIGLISLFIGYFLLTLTNPRGDNWASYLSPILIVGGYGLIIASLLLKER